MKRFIWIAVIFGGSIAALMAASIILQQQAGTVVGGSGDDLKTVVSQLRLALVEGNYEKVCLYTSGISRPTFQKLFDDANRGDPAGRRRFEGVLSVLDTFPSMRFATLKPCRVDVAYKLLDGTSSAELSATFKPGDDGYFLRQIRFAAVGTDNSAEMPIVFHQGEPLDLEALLDRLFDVLTSGNLAEFRTLMMAEGLEQEQLVEYLDRTRREVMSVGVEGLKRMLPETGLLPRGAQRFLLQVAEERRGKTSWMRVDADLTGEGAPRLFGFRAALDARGDVDESPALPKPAPEKP